MKKIYYQMILTQTSPLRIGNGTNKETDNDLLLDGRGFPFIPGTSLAGIFRHRALEQGMISKVEERLFGNIKPFEEIIQSSAIIFGDACLEQDVKPSDILVGRRDGVGLGQWGTVKKSSKFDFQIVETSKKFKTLVEWEGTEEQYHDEIETIIDPIMKHFVEAGIQVGARTSRGYGNMSVSVRKKIFEFPRDLEKWISFNPYDKKMFEDAEELEGKLGEKDAELKIEFQMMSPFSVRVKTVRTELAEDGSLPDTVPLENKAGNPVIPGTAWAGAFRHHMHALLRDVGVLENSEEMNQLDCLFGMGKNSSSVGKSKLTFSESEIKIDSKDDQKMSVVRTAIDRFTASPRTAGLFTNMVYVGGEGCLTIQFDKKAINACQFELLAASICDLHLGMLSLGGEASIGRGIMQITELEYNGKSIKERMKQSIDEGASLNWIEEEVQNV